MHRGEVFFNLQDPQEALDAFTRSIEHLEVLPEDMIEAHLSFISALHGRALVSLELGDTNEPRADLEHGREIRRAKLAI